MEVSSGFSFLIQMSPSLGMRQVLEAVLGMEAAWQDLNWHCETNSHRKSPV
jgi:hypothetical protein